MEDQFTRLSPEEMKKLDGKKLPVTIEVNGEKQVIGEATLSHVEGDLKVDATIQRGFEGLVTPDMRHFSLANTDPDDPANPVQFG